MDTGDVARCLPNPDDCPSRGRLSPATTRFTLRASYLANHSRILEPNGRSIERAELNEHYDQGKFPGLRRQLFAREAFSTFSM
jgi:hypothetical protein